MSSSHFNTNNHTQLQGEERERVLRKIKSCLALGASSNRNEAQTALRQAQTLMAKYRLSDDDVAATAVGSASRSAGVKDVPRWHRDLAAVSAQAFGCIVMRSMNRLVSLPAQFSFVGVAPGCELAAYAYDSLLSQIKTDRAHFLRTCGVRDRSIAKSRADDFCIAWVSQILTQVEGFAQNNGLGQDNSRALVVLAERDKAAIDAWIQTNHGNVPDARKPKKRSVHADSFFQGVAAAKHAKLRQAMSGRDPSDQLALAA